MTANNSPCSSAEQSGPDMTAYAVINTQPKYAMTPIVIAHDGPDEAIARTMEEAEALRRRIVEDVAGDGSHLEVGRIEVHFDATE